MLSEPKNGRSLGTGAAASAILHGILIALALVFLHGTSQAVAPKPKLTVTLELQTPQPPKPPPPKPPPPAPKPMPVVKPTPVPAVITSRALTSVPVPTVPPAPSLHRLAASQPLPDPPAPRPPKQKISKPRPPIVEHHVSSNYKKLLLQKIGANLRYPQSAANNDREGTAMVRITMDRDGTIQDIVLVRGTGTPALDREAQQVFRRIKRFPELPADFAPRASEFQFVIPITFKLVDG